MKIDFDIPRALAVKSLVRIIDEQEFSNDVLLDVLHDASINQLDRSFISALVYGTLEYLPLIDEEIRQASSREFGKIDKNILNILRVGVWQIKFADKVPNSAAVDESVKLTLFFNNKAASGYVNAVLRTIIREPIKLSKKQEHLKYGLSSEIFGLFKKWFDENKAKKIAESFLEKKEGVSLLFLGNEEEKEMWFQECLKEKIEVEKGHLLPNAFILKNFSKSLRSLPGFSQGLIYFQDEVAMLVAETLKLSKAKTLLDACAGLGGKSFAFLANDKNLKITALEPNQTRYSGLLENINRLKIEEIESYKMDIQTYFNKKHQIDLKLFDQVLLDVPCSGLGTLGHKPEIKLKMDYQTIQKFPDIQLEILQYGAKFLRPNGLLTYSTCTLNPDENENNIQRFLETDSGKCFEIVPLDEILTSINGQYREQIKCGLDNFGLTLLPDLIPVDGFFISCLRKL